MTHTTYPSIAKFQQFVELKDFWPPTRKEYVRSVRQRVRHFGWLSPAARKRWQRIQALLHWKPSSCTTPRARSAQSYVWG